MTKKIKNKSDTINLKPKKKFLLKYNVQLKWCSRLVIKQNYALKIGKVLEAITLWVVGVEITRVITCIYLNCNCN